VSSTSSLYNDVIMDHIKNARNYRELAEANRRAEGINPLCGDTFTIYSLGEKITDPTTGEELGQTETKAGNSGTLTLSGANNFSGGVTLSAGALNINNASALGSGALSIAGSGGSPLPCNRGRPNTKTR